MVTEQEARDALEAAGGSQWEAAIAVYHAKYLAAFAELGFDVQVEGSLCPVVRRRSLP